MRVLGAAAQHSERNDESHKEGKPQKCEEDVQWRVELVHRALHFGPVRLLTMQWHIFMTPASHCKRNVMLSALYTHTCLDQVPPRCWFECGPLSRDHHHALALNTGQDEHEIRVCAIPYGASKVTVCIQSLVCCLSQNAYCLFNLPRRFTTSHVGMHS